MVFVTDPKTRASKKRDDEDDENYSAFLASMNIDCNMEIIMFVELGSLDVVESAATSVHIRLSMARG